MPFPHTPVWSTNWENCCRQHPALALLSLVIFLFSCRAHARACVCLCVCVCVSFFFFCIRVVLTLTHTGLPPKKKKKSLKWYDEFPHQKATLRDQPKFRTAVYVCGVSNWLLSLTKYGNNRLFPQRRELPGHIAGSQRACRCRSLALF